jgi:hypothetical protein
MNWLKISLFGLGLAMIAGMACSSSNSNTPPLTLGGSGGNGGMSGAGGATGTGGAIDTGGTTATDSSTIVDAGVDSAIDRVVDVVAGDAGADSGVGIFTKEGNSAILNAPTTGGLDVTGPTPPAYQTCK